MNAYPTSVVNNLNLIKMRNCYFSENKNNPFDRCRSIVWMRLGSGLSMSCPLIRPGSLFVFYSLTLSLSTSTFPPSHSIRNSGHLRKASLSLSLSLAPTQPCSHLTTNLNLLFKNKRGNNRRREMEIYHKMCIVLKNGLTFWVLLYN